MYPLITQVIFQYTDATAFTTPSQRGPGRELRGLEATVMLGRIHWRSAQLPHLLITCNTSVFTPHSTKPIIMIIKKNTLFFFFLNDQIPVEIACLELVRAVKSNMTNL